MASLHQDWDLRVKSSSIVYFYCVKFGMIIRQLSEAANNPFIMRQSSKENEYPSKGRTVARPT